MILLIFGLEWPLYHSYKNPPSVLKQQGKTGPCASVVSSADLVRKYKGSMVQS